jgi:hypothetical protein
MGRVSLHGTLEVLALERYADSAIHNLLTGRGFRWQRSVELSPYGTASNASSVNAQTSLKRRAHVFVAISALGGATS